MGVLTTDNIIDVKNLGSYNMNSCPETAYFIGFEPVDGGSKPLRFNFSNVFDFRKWKVSVLDDIGLGLLYALDKGFFYITYDSAQETWVKKIHSSGYEFLNDLFDIAFSETANDLSFREKVISFINEQITKSATESSLPIGFIYVQFPFTDDPATLGMAGTWENITSQFNGAFFRAENRNINGGLLSEDFQVLQSAGLPNIKGTFGTVPTGEGYDSQNTGAFYFIKHTAESDTWGNDNGQRSVYGFDASLYNSLYGSSNSVTPMNYAIRIWKRVN